VAIDSIVGFCPYCNRISNLEVSAQVYGTAPKLLFDQLDTDEDGLRPACYTIAFCPNCESVFLHVSAKSEPSEIPYEAMLYPSSYRRSISGVPKNIQRIFESARSCFETGNYEPCIIMCRKCLEAICIFMGVKKGRLEKRLQKLKDSGLIEERLYDWAEQLRLFGNDAAHEIDLNISKDDALDSLEFVEAILLYVFELNERFQKFRARRNKLKQSESEYPSNEPIQTDSPSGCR